MKCKITMYDDSQTKEFNVEFRTIVQMKTQYGLFLKEKNVFEFAFNHVFFNLLSDLFFKEKEQDIIVNDYKTFKLYLYNIMLKDIIYYIKDGDQKYPYSKILDSNKLKDYYYELISTKIKKFELFYSVEKIYIIEFSGMNNFNFSIEFDEQEAVLLKNKLIELGYQS